MLAGIIKVTHVFVGSVKVDLTIVPSCQEGSCCSIYTLAYAYRRRLLLLLMLLLLQLRGTKICKV